MYLESSAMNYEDFQCSKIIKECKARFVEQCNKIIRECKARFVEQTWAP